MIFLRSGFSIVPDGTDICYCRCPDIEIVRRQFIFSGPAVFFVSDHSDIIGVNGDIPVVGGFAFEGL